MATGQIKKIVEDRGFGFIRQDERSQDLFFHATAVEGVEFKELKEGDKVTFTVEEGKRGPRAMGVTRHAD